MICFEWVKVKINTIQTEVKWKKYTLRKRTSQCMREWQKNHKKPCDFNKNLIIRYFVWLMFSRITRLRFWVHLSNFSVLNGFIKFNLDTVAPSVMWIWKLLFFFRSHIWLSVNQAWLEVLSWVNSYLLHKCIGSAGIECEEISSKKQKD